MSGNVWEWCHSEPEEVDIINAICVWRGGSWISYQHDARAAYRFSYRPFARIYIFGFRVVVRRPPSHVL